MEELTTRVNEWLALYGFRVLGALLILIIGRWVAMILRKVVERAMTKAKAEPTLIAFVTHLTYVALITFVVLAALSKLGIQTTSFIAVLGAAGLAVGLALQGSLSNFAAGVLLIIFRPFKVGDFIEAGGVAGVVEEIQIFTTQLATPDNKTVIVPNAQVTGGNITNYSVKGTRRVDLVIGVSYSADIKRVEEVIRDVLSKDERILAEPAPNVAVMELADSSVNFAVRPWTTASEYWNVYFGMVAAIKMRLDEEGIEIPFPQRDVHIYNEAPTA